MYVGMYDYAMFRKNIKWEWGICCQRTSIGYYEVRKHAGNVKQLDLMLFSRERRNGQIWEPQNTGFGT